MRIHNKNCLWRKRGISDVHATGPVGIATYYPYESISNEEIYSRSLKHGVLVCLLFAATALGLRAQTVQGVITGTVSDQSGAVVPNAVVMMTNEGTNISETRTTGSNGLYRCPLVPPGTYTVTVTASGFAKNVTKGVVVEASKAVPWDIVSAWLRMNTIIYIFLYGIT